MRILLEKHYGRKVIVLIDEYDVPLAKAYENGFYDEMVLLIRNIFGNVLKTNESLAFAVLTGCLRIAKESIFTGLNNFKVYSITDVEFDETFGFTNEEVLALCEKNDEIKFSDQESWYNGYLNTKGKKIYNPRSVIKALENGYCESYWTNTGAMDEVTDYLKYNTLEIREDVIEMVSGEEVDIFIDEEFRAGQREPRTKEEIYSAMIILGFLSYHDGYLRIPN